MWPALIINLKQYIPRKTVSAYLQTAEKLAEKYQKELIVCVDSGDLKSVATTSRKFVKIFAQNFNHASLSPKTLMDLGISGSLLNHYDFRLYGEKAGADKKIRNSAADFKQLIELIKSAYVLGLSLVVCADTAKTAEKIAREILTLQIKNVALAVEWDEFIGSKISMVQEKPQEIKETVQLVHSVDNQIPVYCGAGVQGADVAQAIKEFGVQGALVATYCTKAPEFQGDYEKAIETILKSLPQVFKKVTKEMLISEALQICPDALEIMFEYGLHCVGCGGAFYETIEEGSLAHGISAEKIEEMVGKINQKLKKSSQN